MPKRVVVFADTAWSVQRVHKGIEKALAGEYTFIYHDSAKFYHQQFLEDVKNSDICLTTLHLYGDILFFLPNDADKRKVAFVCHGDREYNAIQTDSSSLFTYGSTSSVILAYLNTRIARPIHIVPNGVDPSGFKWRARSGRIRGLGWCGSPNVDFKRFGWGIQIAAATRLPLNLAATLSEADLIDWYNNIDLLIVTAGPNPDAETGPLPPFEAIVSGVLAIGTAVGNFASVPGPKFSTVEEATAIIERLKADPAEVRRLAKEQYDAVMANWTYDALAASWRALFEAVTRRTYDFIEIGTSDFDTELQSSSADAKGLSIDPLQFYLDNLPEKMGVKKIRAAISDTNGEIELYYVLPEFIEKYALPHWVRGCNKIGAQHPIVVRLLESMGLDPLNIISRDVVVMKDIPTLFTEYNVDGIDTLKIDTEGHDCIILANYIDHCVSRPHLFANKIIFETNSLSSAEDQNQIIDRLISHGYRLYSRDHKAVLVLDPSL